MLPAFVGILLNLSLSLLQYSTTCRAACNPWLSQQNELAHSFCPRDLSKNLKDILTKLTRRPQLKKKKLKKLPDIERMANKDTKNMFKELEMVI